MNNKKKCRSPATKDREKENWYKEKEIKDLMSHESYSRNKRGALTNRRKAVIK